MVVHNSSMLVVMAVAGTIATRIATRLAQSIPSDATQFLVEVTLVSNLLCIFVTLFAVIYIRIAYPHMIYEKPARTFHSHRYEIVPYINGNKAIKEPNMRFD